MAITQIRHDPFARGSVIRETVIARYRSECAWCGSRPGKFRYGWSRDDSSFRDYDAFDTKAFCSISCRTNYYN